MRLDLSSLPVASLVALTLGFGCKSAEPSAASAAAGAAVPAAPAPVSPAPSPIPAPSAPVESPSPAAVGGPPVAVAKTTPTPASLTPPPAPAPSTPAPSAPLEAAADVPARQAETAQEETATPVVLTKAEARGAVGTAPIPPVEGVPGLHFRAVELEAAATAARSNKEGLGRHKKQDYTGASSLYLKALEADPAHVFARYNLACAFARLGDPRAKAVLAQLSAAGCERCLGRVAAAPNDPDFESIKDDPELVSMAKAAAARTAAGQVALFDVQLAAGDPTTAVWSSLRPGYPFQLGDRLTLSWERPVRVTQVEFSPAECGAIWTTLVSFPSAPAQEVTDSGTLATPVDTTSLTLMVTATNEALECSPPSHRVRVLGVAPSGAAPSGDAPVGGVRLETEAVAGAPSDSATAGSAATPTPAEELHWSSESAQVIADGYPIASEDGSFVAWVEGPSPEDYDQRDTVLRVVRPSTGEGVLQLQLRRGFSGDAGPKDDGAVPGRIAEATRKLRALAPVWRSLTEVGGGDSWDSRPGLPSGLYAHFDGRRVRVVTVTGETLHESDRPAWAREPSGFNPGDEPVTIRFSGAWVDERRKTLVYRVGFHPGVCAGGDAYTWQALSL